MQQLLGTWIRKHLITILLVIIGLVVLFSIYSILDLRSVIFNESFIPPDSLTYMDASNLLFREFTPHHTRPLGYAFILGFPNLFMQMNTHDYIVWGIIVNSISWLAMLVLCFKTFKEYVKKWMAFVLTCVLFIFLSYYGFIFLVLTETITATGLVFIAYLFTKHNRTKNPNYFLSGVAIILLLVLIRPGFSLLAICALLFAIIRFRGKAFKHILLSCSLLLLIVQCSWIKITYGNFKPSYIDGITWYLYSGAQLEAKVSGKTLAEVSTERNAELAKNSYAMGEKIAKNDLREKVTHHTSLVYQQLKQNNYENVVSGCYAFIGLKLYHPKKSKQQLGQKFFDISLNQNKNASAIIFWLTFLTLIFALKINYITLFCLGTVWYINITSSISFWQGDRFNMVLYPILLIWFVAISAIALSSIKQLKEKMLYFAKTRLNK